MSLQKIATKKNPRLVLIGSFGAGNVGDELILAGFLRQLRKKIPAARIVVLSADPADTKSRHEVRALPQLPTGVRSFFRFDWKKSRREIAKADAVIFPGGGLFVDEESWRAPLVWAIHALAAVAAWRPLYFFGQSVGPLSRSLSRQLAWKSFRAAEFVEVRDESSAAVLKKLGVPPRRILFGRDAAFGLVDRLPKIRELPKKGRLKILISLRDYPNLPAKFFSEFARGLDEICEWQQVRISFAEFVAGDAAAWQKIEANSESCLNCKKIDLPKNPDELLAKIADFDLVIGMRLHSLVAARLTGVPSIAISYSPKVAGFHSSIGREKFTLDTKKLDKKALLKMMRNIKKINFFT